MKQLNDKIEIKNKICLNCLSKNVEIQYEKTDLDGQPNWLPVIYFHPYIVCKEKKCGEILSAPEAAKIYHDASCIAQGILRPMEIREIRKKIQELYPSWGKNDQHFSKTFKVGVSQMSRWERGEYFINKKDEHDLKQLLINEDYRKSFEVDSSTEDDRDKYLGNVFTTLEEIGKLQSTKEINPEEIFA